MPRRIRAREGSPVLRWLEEFRIDMQARGWSPVTVQGTLASLGVFEKWLGSEDPRDVTTQTLKEYIESARTYPLLERLEAAFNRVR